jgi:putative PIN family toxin of toxin-antitoxin system
VGTLGAPIEPRALPMRVVLDTNVLLSALVFSGGVAARLRRCWPAGTILPLVSTETARELVRVLAYPKFGLDADDREQLLGDFLPWAEVVDIPEPPPPAPTCRDPDDGMFLVLAVVGEAECLFSGDADLLSLASTGDKLNPGLRISTMQAFMEMLDRPKP